MWADDYDHSSIWLCIRFLYSTDESLFEAYNSVSVTALKQTLHDFDYNNNRFPAILVFTFCIDIIRIQTQCIHIRYDNDLTLIDIDIEAHN